MNVKLNHLMNASLSSVQAFQIKRKQDKSDLYHCGNFKRCLKKYMKNEKWYVAIYFKV